MTKWLTVEQGIYRVRPLTADDFVIDPEWRIGTVEDIVKGYGASASLTLRLKQYHLDNLLDVWPKHDLWKDWNYTGENNYKEIRTHLQISLKVDYRGCRNKQKKAKAIFSELVTKSYTDKKVLLAEALAEFNKNTQRKIEDKNRWTIRSAVEQYSGPGPYPKLKEQGKVKDLATEIALLREEIQRKVIQKQLLERQYILSLWEGAEGEKYPVEIRQEVIAKVKADLAKLEQGKGIEGPFGLVA